jgi:hypothetical protein
MLRILSLAFIVFIISCKEQNKQTTNNNTTQTDTIPFYPYSTFIKNQADSLIKNNAVFTLAYTNQQNKTTNKQISAEEFKTYVHQITKYDITLMPLKQYYKEVLFTDLTTASTVINYDTQKDSLTVKNVSVLLDAKNTNAVKRIDLKVMYNSADSTVTENCSWVNDKAFYIVRYAEDTTGKSVSTKINISWNKQ